MLACVYEDRASDVVAVKLLVSSLERHCPGLAVEVTVPDADAATRAWFARRPHARLRTERPRTHGGYDVKPFLLGRALADGADQALWIDSDVIVSRDVRPLFAGTAPEALGVTEEIFGVPHEGGTVRTTGMGLPTGRRMRRTVNTSVLRVTAAHTALLAEWGRWLGTPAYREAQAAAWYDRPLWFLTDQEVLTGLLGSAPFAHVPIRWLRRGPDIAHCFHLGGTGYTVFQRLANVARGHTPPFVHSVGDRPWRPAAGRPTLHLETSPYTLAAAAYRDEVGEPLPWTSATLPAARVCRALARGGLTASGLLPALGRELRDQRTLKTLLRSATGAR